MPVTCAQPRLCDGNIVGLFPELLKAALKTELTTVIQHSSPFLCLCLNSASRNTVFVLTLSLFCAAQPHLLPAPTLFHWNTDLNKPYCSLYLDALERASPLRLIEPSPLASGYPQRAHGRLTFLNVELDSATGSSIAIT
jgi:hypothetical protein